MDSKQLDALLNRQHGMECPVEQALLQVAKFD